MKNKSKSKAQIIKELKITESEYLKANRRIKTIEKYIRLKNEGVSESEIKTILKSSKSSKLGIEGCKKYIEENPGLFG